MAQCTAHSSRTGAQCRASAIRGGTVCVTHGGAAPQVKAKALERLQAAADPVSAELIRLALHGDSEQVRVAAAKDILDRAGLSAKQIVESEVTVYDGGSEVDREIKRLAAELAERAAGRSPGGAALAGHGETGTAAAG